MLRTGSSAAGAAACRPPQADAQSASPMAEMSALGAREFRAEPLMELAYDILFRHYHAACMRSRVQAQLIELAHLRVLGHDEIGEIHHISHVEVRVGQS